MLLSADAPTESAARSGRLLIRAIECASDHVTIEEVLADVLTMTLGGDAARGSAETCLNVRSHGELVS